MKKEISFALNYALNKGFQVHPDAFRILESIDSKQLEYVIKEIVKEKSRQKLFLINQDDLESYLGIKNNEDEKIEFKVLYDPTSNITSAEGIDGFKSLFDSRFNKLRRIISDRPESRMLKSISSVTSTKFNDDIYVGGLVSSKDSERNIIRINLEDSTGTIEILIFDEDLKKTADLLLIDQFIMARISSSKNGGYVCKDIILPDIPDHSSNRSESEVYAAFLSDLHVGSKFFLEEEMRSFVSWLSAPDPVARKVRFLILGGDVIDGVGIYPNQDKELVYQTLEEQLEKLMNVLKDVPKNVKIVIIPGNHDPGRRALPQPAIPLKYNQNLWNQENVTMLGNPAMISLNGVKVLIFHGQSIDDIVKTTPGLSYDQPANVMKQLLKARHLSPIYGSQTPLAPEIEDMLTIDDIPDIFHVGHVHVTQLDIYKGILLLNSGTWQRQTPFQASVGISPTPGLAILVNLKTFKVYQKDFTV